MSADRWGMCFQAVNRYPVPQTQGELDEQGELYQLLKKLIEDSKDIINRNGGSADIDCELTEGQTERLKSILGDRNTQRWTTGAWFEVIVPILEAL